MEEKVEAEKLWFDSMFPLMFGDCSILFNFIFQGSETQNIRPQHDPHQLSKASSGLSEGVTKACHTNTENLQRDSISGKKIDQGDDSFLEAL